MIFSQSILFGLRRLRFSALLSISVWCSIVVLGWGSLAFAQIAFEDVSESANIDHKGESWSAAWGDVNADGYQDIFVSNHGTFGASPPSLYVNQGNGSFLDLYEKWFPYVRRDFHGSGWSDFDNDGDLDLFISSGGSRGEAVRSQKPNVTDSNVLWVQEGGLFSDQAMSRGLAEPFGRGRAPIWWDLNRDGLLDIVLTKAAPMAPDLFAYQQQVNGRFTPCGSVMELATDVDAISSVTGVRLPRTDSLHLLAQIGGRRVALLKAKEPCQFVPVKKDAFSILRANQFFVADFRRDLKPVLVTVRAKKHDYVALPTPERLVMQFIAAKRGPIKRDFASEGELDFVRISPLGPDFWNDNKIFIGSDGSHPLSRPFSLSSENSSHHGIFDLDKEEMGIAIGYMKDIQQWRLHIKSGNLRKRVTIEISSTSSIEYTPYKEDLFDPSQGQVAGQFYELLPDGLTDVSKELGWTYKTSCRTVVAADFDNDGDQDIYLGCRGEVSNFPNRLFENVNGEGFRELKNIGADGSDKGLTDAVTVGDYDNDGFLDLFLTNGAGRFYVDDGPHQLLRNLGNENHWIKFNLIGTNSPRDAYGARVFLTSMGETQVRDFTGGFHFGSQHDSRVHFGIGRNNSIDAVIVQWPSGGIERFDGHTVDQIYNLHEGSGLSLDDGTIIVSQEQLSAGDKLTFIALAGKSLRQDSLEWYMGDQQIAENCISCSQVVREGGVSVISATGSFTDGSLFSVEKSIVVQ